MTVNDVLAQLQQLLRKSTPLVEGAERLPESFLRFSPGQQVTATVLSQLPNGRFLVQVNDQHLDLNLPRNTQPGSQVELRYVGAHPRPTFLLETQPTASPRPAVNLSDTARFIHALLSRAGQLGEETAPLARSTPILPAPPANGAPDVAQLALALKSTLTHSGLFYESHQAQWVTGQRTLAELLREPQGRLAEPRAHLAARAGMADPDARPMAPQPPEGGASRESAPRESSVPVPPAEPREPVHPQAAALVRQQLEVLDLRQLVWQGELWPGQTLRWEVEEREGEGSAPGEREWATRVHLTLPRLGEVEARLRLTAQGVQVDILATPETAPRLGAQVKALRAGFERAGLLLAQVRVATHG
jgi:hypothetical protein